MQVMCSSGGSMPRRQFSFGARTSFSPVVECRDLAFVALPVCFATLRALDAKLQCVCLRHDVLCSNRMGRHARRAGNTP